ncbi:unnamed protein product [Lupinus luteus]|uniref:BED-type domain-containing protein n=1 Tax=Lupinus luteus TaxID=3873 RepID=A0AAV1W6P7_LUPLU
MSNDEEQIEMSSPSTKRARSTAWEYFDKFTDKDGDPKVMCKKCGRLYMSKEGGGTSNMIRHIRICGNELEEIQKVSYELCLYLKDLANANDVPSYVKKHPFGQSAITSSHSG